MAVPDDWCAVHGVPESLCVECNSDDYPQRELHGWCKIHGIHECPLHQPDVAQVKETPQIKQGEILALIDAADVGRVKARVLAAMAQEKLQQQIQIRLKGLADKGIVPGRQLQEAETALSQARTRVISAQQTLTNLGLPISIDHFQGLSESEVAKRIQFLGFPRVHFGHT